MFAFRRSLLKNLPKRGGGHEHPDFPHVGYYKHKRIISMFDTNMWVYDGLMPEYLVDIQYPQIRLGTQVTHTMLWGGIFPLIAGFFMSLFVYSKFKRPFKESQVVNDQDNVKRMLKTFTEEKPFLHKHPLGHFHSYQDEGWTTAAEHWIYKRYKL